MLPLILISLYHINISHWDYYYLLTIHHHEKYHYHVFPWSASMMQLCSEAKKSPSSMDATQLLDSS